MILVTGGTGLVGAHLLLHLLKKEESVRAIYRSEKKRNKTKALFEQFNQSHLFEQIDWIEADINDIPALETAFESISFVYHCAAQISFDPDDEEKLRKVNIEGTANVVNCTLDFKVQKICFVSSIASLGDLASHEKTITEETEWNPEKPHSDYALSKYGAEMEIWRAYQEGLSIIIVNPGVILGAGFWNSGSGEIFKKIGNGIPFYTKGSTGFVEVNDLVSIMYTLMKSEISGERFTIISENIYYNDIMFWISDALKKKKPFILAKPWMTSFAWRMDWLFSKLFFTKRKLTRPIAKSLHSNVFYSNNKIEKELNYSFKSIKDSCYDLALLYKKSTNSNS